MLSGANLGDAIADHENLTQQVKLDWSSAASCLTCVPARMEAIDIDGDGDLDLVVASLGVLMPCTNRVGSVIVFENDGQQRFARHVLADRIARVADARAGDLDGDGDLDLAVTGFAYDDGETSWLENTGDWTFEPHVLLRVSGLC